MASYASDLLAAVGQTISASSPMAVITVDPTGHVDLCEGGTIDLFSQPCPQLHGRLVTSLVAHVPELARTLQRSLEGENANLVITHNGRTYETWISARHDAQGRPDGLVWVTIDVTERVLNHEQLQDSHEQLEHAVEERTADLNRMNQQLRQEVAQRRRFEDALRHSEERAHAILQSSPDAVVVFDTAGSILEWNLPASTLFGWERDEVVGQSLLGRLMPPRWRNALGEGLASFLDVGHSPLLDQRIECTVLHRDGHEIPVEVTITVLHTGGGVTFAGFIRDITDRLRAGQALRDSEQRTRMIISSALDGVIVVDEQVNIIDWNPQAQEIFGWSRPEVIGRPMCTLLIDADDAARVRDTILECTQVPEAGAARRRFEVRGRRKTGHPFIVELSITALTLGDGCEYSIFVRDITPRKRMEQALRETNSRLEALVQHAPAAIVTLDESDRVVEWNPAAERLFGYRGVEVLGKPYPIVPSDQIEQYRAVLARVRRGESVSEIEVLRTRQDGTRFKSRLFSMPLHDEQGRYTGRIAILTNVDAMVPAAGQ